MRVKLKDICNITMGQSPESKYYSNNNGFPFLQGNRTFGLKYPIIDTYTQRITKIATKGSVLMSVRAPVGDLNIANQDICIGRGLVSLTSKNNDNEFLYYSLKANISNIISKGNGTTYDSITTEILKNIEIDIPNSLNSCNKISIILSNIDDQIERNNAMCKRLQDLGNTIYSNSFKDINEYISFTQSPYFEIIKPSIDVFKGTKHYIPTAEVEGLHLNFNSSLITYENRESRANMQPIYHSVWFAKMKNSIKHIYLPKNAEYLVNNYIFSTGFCGLKCKDYAFEFLVGFVELPYFENIKDTLAHGATMESVNNDDLQSIKIPNVSEKEVKEYHTKTKDIYEQIHNLTLESYKLQTLKETLLPLLINGQLVV